ncbi:Fur family transcriptional regulator [Nesterenkonia haasae]|uniref:Fur family transcriptional regulator n=1 Tax=Nesterenkonia haasae TaxID=2587813 RepID=UPI0013915748|nr:Fur family transcriptional regulator [Nesterenkonia haasae]NDK33144.1 transcriptional repressor [Nesterenkonia haasae]
MPQDPPFPPVEGRSTRQKRAVWAALASVDGFVSAKTLHHRLEERGDDVALATVYRFLQSQLEAGTVDSLLNPDDGEALYRICAAQTHHHHLVCRECGIATEFKVPEIDRLARTVAVNEGFSETVLTFDVFGICPACQSPSNHVD